MSLPRAALAGAVFLLMSASSSVTNAAVTPKPQNGTHAVTDHTDANSDWAALIASMDTMHRSMAGVGQTEDSDLNFVNIMLPHHQAALEMAKVQLKYGTDPQMRRLAQEIVTDQQSEIELMQLWLKQHHARTLNPQTK